MSNPQCCGTDLLRSWKHTLFVEMKKPHCSIVCIVCSCEETRRKQQCIHSWCFQLLNIRIYMCPKLFKKRFEKSHNHAPLNECTVPVLTPNLMNGFPLCSDHSKDLKYEKCYCAYCYHTFICFTTNKCACSFHLIFFIQELGSYPETMSSFWIFHNHPSMAELLHNAFALICCDVKCLIMSRFRWFCINICKNWND